MQSLSSQKLQLINVYYLFFWGEGGLKLRDLNQKAMFYGRAQHIFHEENGQMFIVLNKRKDYYRAIRARIITLK